MRAGRRRVIGYAFAAILAVVTAFGIALAFYVLRASTRGPKWVVDPEHAVLHELEGVPLRVPLVLYPGAEVQSVVDVSEAAGEPTASFLLGTKADPHEVVRYYLREFRALGRARMYRLKRLRTVRVIRLWVHGEDCGVVVFRGSGKVRDASELRWSDNGDETKILITLPVRGHQTRLKRAAGRVNNPPGK